MYGQDLGLISQETLGQLHELARKSFADTQAGVQKAITTSTGLIGVDLEAPSKKLFPVLSPLRNRIPRKPGATGAASVQWKAITGINTAKVKASVAFGTRNSEISYAEVDKSATYKTIGLDDSVQDEAMWQGRGFEDVRALSALSCLQAVMIEEEKLILGGNGTTGIALGTAPTPTLDVSAAGGCTGTFNVVIVALTLHGYLNRTVNASGVTTAILVGTERSKKGTAASTGAITSKKIVATWTTVIGAVAYAVYAGAAGSETLQNVVTANYWDSGTGALTGTGQALTALTPDSDVSQDTNTFDGLIPQVMKTGSGAYLRSLDNAALTADNAGGVVELDTMLQSLWENQQIGPTLILLNSQEALNITKKVTGGTGNVTGWSVTLTPGDQKNITGGFYISGYLNKFTSSLTPGSPDIVPFLIHPNLPPGMLISLSERLPYPKSDVDAVFLIRMLQEYADFEWARTQRKYEHGVYAHEVLQCYFTGGCGIISNIKNA